MDEAEGADSDAVTGAGFLARYVASLGTGIDYAASSGICSGDRQASPKGGRSKQRPYDGAGETPALHALSRKHARDGGEIVGDADGGPDGCVVEERTNAVKRAKTDFADEDSAATQKFSCLRDERGVDFSTVRATKESRVRLMFADFAGKRLRFFATDVGRIADDEIERQGRGVRGWG
jgi:hypothetical protein